MPNTLSAEKALRQSKKRHAKNSADKDSIKTMVKSLKTAKLTPDILKEEYSKLQSLLDKAAKNKVLHKNKVARLKSRLLKAAHVATTTNKGKSGKSKNS